MGPRCYPLLEEFRAPPLLSDLSRARHGDDDGDIHQAAPDVDDPEIALVVDVHFTQSADIPDVPVVRDERESFGEKSAGVSKAESLSNN